MYMAYYCFLTYNTNAFIVDSYTPNTPFWTR